jgi:small subunit ribosomal protein S8
MTIDPVSDMLTTIRNGLKARLYSVETPASKLKAEIARVMKEAGYIADVLTTSEFPKKLVITLKYSDKAAPAITEIKRISKPGLRRYAPCDKIPSVLDGMGLVILSTSKGVMSGVSAKKERLGGEIICTVA